MVCVYIWKEIHGIVSCDSRARQVKNLQDGPADWRPRRVNIPVLIWELTVVELGRASVADEVQRQPPGEFFLARGWGQSFCYMQAFNWFDETHPHNGNYLLYSKPINLNLTQKYSHTQNTGGPNIWAPCIQPSWHTITVLQHCRFPLTFPATRTWWGNSWQNRCGSQSSNPILKASIEQWIGSRDNKLITGTAFLNYPKNP